MKKLNTLFTIIFACASVSASAGNFNVSIDQTIHVGAKGTYNNTHPMIEYESSNSWVTGGYLNSENRLSLYTGKRIYFNKVSVDLGVVTGYKAYAVLPAVQVQYHIDKNFKLFLFPSIEINGNKKQILPVVGVRYVF